MFSGHSVSRNSCLNQKYEFGEESERNSTLPVLRGDRVECIEIGQRNGEFCCKILDFYHSKGNGPVAGTWPLQHTICHIAHHAHIAKAALNGVADCEECRKVVVPSCQRVLDPTHGEVWEASVVLCLGCNL